MPEACREFRQNGPPDKNSISPGGLIRDSLIVISSYNSVVTESTEAQKWGARAAALVRVAGRTRQGRIASAALAGARATWLATTRVLHLLFLEITGFFFVVFAMVGGFATWREYLRYKTGLIGPGRAILAGCFATVFLWFAISSFWRVQRRK
jgi:hypothetical protein